MSGKKRSSIYKSGSF